MIGYRQYLEEIKVHKITPKFHVFDIAVFEIANLSELTAQLRKFRMGCRGLLVNLHTLYVWDASTATHGEVGPELGLIVHANDKNICYLTIEMFDEQMLQIWAYGGPSRKLTTEKFTPRLLQLFGDIVKFG